MPITLDDDAVLLDSGIRMKWIRDAEYDSAPPLVAFADDVQTLLQCTPEGKLKVDASVTIDSVDIGDVNLNLKVGGVDHAWNGVLTASPGVYAGLVQDPRMSFSGARLNVDVSGSAPPTGTALESTQLLVKANTDNLNVSLSTRASETTLSAIKLQTDKLTFVGDELKVIADLSLTTVGIENAADVRINPSTEEKQDVGNASLATIAAKDFATQTTLSALNAKVVIVDTGAVTISTALPAGANTIGKVDQGLGGASAWKVDGSAVTQPVSGAFFQATQPVSGPLTDTQLRATPVPVSGTVTATGPLTDTELRASAVPVSGPLTDVQLRAAAVAISAASLPLPAGASTSALQTTGNSSLSSIDGKLNSLGQKTMAASVPVVIASDQGALPVSIGASFASTATLANVSGSLTSVTIAAANANRKGLTIYNDGNVNAAVIYIKFGATASTTSYTVQIARNAYYEMPQPVYTGIVDGIWSTSSNGTARVTELT